jgi:hypothetical protein
MSFLRSESINRNERLNSDPIVHGFAEPLFAPQIFFCRLDGDMPQQKLDLLQFAT